MGNVRFVRGPQGPAHGDVRGAGGIRDAEAVGDPGGRRAVDRHRAHARRRWVSRGSIWATPGSTCRSPMRLAPSRASTGCRSCSRCWGARSRWCVLRRPRRELAWLLVAAAALILPAAPPPAARHRARAAGAAERRYRDGVDHRIRSRAWSAIWRCSHTRQARISSSGRRCPRRSIRATRSFASTWKRSRAPSIPISCSAASGTTPIARR